MGRMRNGGMRPPDETLPPDDGSTEARTRRALHRISQSLGVPPETFLAPPAAQTPEAAQGDEPASDKECAELVEAFRRIGDPQVRRRYLSVLQSLAQL